MMYLNSHPDLQLCEHIEQVQCAVDSLCRRHSSKILTFKEKELLKDIVVLHDLGKGTAAFQKYIKNPSGYRGDPREKAHTPLSLLISLLVSRKNKWNYIDTLIIAAAVYGHHGELPTIEKLREIGCGELAKLLKSQTADLLREALYQHSGIYLEELFKEERVWAKAQFFLDDYVLPAFEKLTIPESLETRMRAQLLYSLLLEADKAFLAIKEPEKYIKSHSKYWDPQWVEDRINTFEKSPENEVKKIRQSIRTLLNSEIEKIQSNGVFSLTAPTGTGKTLLSATWLLRLRKKFDSEGIVPKAIVVLPFLSVIDQTTEEYKEILKNAGEEHDGSWLLTSHSLSDRRYGTDLEEGIGHFFIDTWRTEIVITTYDQFLMTLMDSKARYQMRFHNLCDALIVMDEVQALPCLLWKPLEETLKVLANKGNSSILLMSATLPSIISDAKPLIECYEEYFKHLNRYKLVFRLERRLNIRDFAGELIPRRDEWLKEKRRILITLNTRGSARLIYDILLKDWPKEYDNIPLLFISADVTPQDRLEKIGIIKQGKPCIVISTQCIEAGVDIDMEYVIRDFAPLDSMVQIAGRCNRNGHLLDHSTVEIVDLVNGKGKRYSEMIYDEVHLQVTRQVLEGYEEIEERDILSFTRRFFDQLLGKKDTGKAHLENFAKMRTVESVKTLLRGKEREKYDFIVIKENPALKEEMRIANEVKDKWSKREAWRALAGKISRITISVYAKTGFEPGDIAEEYLGHSLLKDSFYSKECGLNYKDESDEVVCKIL